MPKLEHDEEDFDPSTHTLSANAQTSLSNKLGNGGSFTPSTSANPFSPSQSTFNSGTPLAQQNAFAGTGGGTSFTGGTGTTSGFGTNPFGNSNAGFGSSAGLNNQQSGPESLVENTNTDWINNKYRPMMGWAYMLICICDFVFFPIAWTTIQALFHGGITAQWQPITLQGGGLVHIAFGAIIGITSWGRSKEKLAGKA